MATILYNVLDNLNYFCEVFRKNKEARPECFTTSSVTERTQYLRWEISQLICGEDLERAAKMLNGVQSSRDEKTIISAKLGLIELSCNNDATILELLDGIRNDHGLPLPLRQDG